MLILISLFSGMAAGGERGSGGVDMRYVQLFIALQVQYKRLANYASITSREATRLSVIKVIG